jgi:HEAT repeat protein
MVFLHGSKNMKSRHKNEKKTTALTGPIATFTLITYALLCCGCVQTVRTTTRIEWPAAYDSPENLVPEATRIIREGLADPEPVVRVNAIEVVARTKQTMLIPKVQRLLKDNFVPVRFAAILAVGDMEYSLGTNTLRQLLQDKNENVRIAALYALARLGSTESLQQLRRAITSTDQTVRANAALLLGKSGDTSDLTRQALWWTLRRPESGDMVRFQTAESLAMLSDERIYPSLWGMLISKYADDRVMGIKAMGKLKTLQAKDALATMLDDKVVEVRLAAAEQLGAFNDPIGEQVVLDVFRKNLTAGLDQQSLERLNIRTVMAIGRIGTPALKKYLPRFLKDESKTVRIAAAMAVFQTATNN